MTDEEILQGIEEIAHQHLQRPGRLTPEMELVEDLELDSLLLLTLAVEVENRFEICIDQQEEASIRTVGDLVAVVGRQVSLARGRPADA